MLIFCILLIFALIFTTFDREAYLLDTSKKSHLKHVLYVHEKFKISDFYVFQSNAAT